MVDRSLRFLGRSGASGGQCVTQQIRYALARITLQITHEGAAMNPHGSHSSQRPLALSVVIPTADRAATLEATLRTATQQDYADLQILVSDNASTDHTRDVVEACRDSRVEYINTGRRLGMASNWEFALGHVKGDYVFFLGDDDGLLPSACRDTSDLLTFTNAQALAWEKPNYSWPDSFAKPNQLDVCFDQDLFWLPGRFLTWAIARGYTSYGRLPNLYTSFVSMNVVKKIRQTTGRFFESVTPDVYSGIVLAQAIPDYLYSLRPFSINGGSSKSNGQSINRPDDFSQRFFREADIPINERLPLIPGALASCVAESFLQAQAHGLTGNLKLNERKYHRLIFAQLKRQARPDVTVAGCETLLRLTKSGRLRRRIAAEIEVQRRKSDCAEAAPVTPRHQQASVLTNKRLGLNAARLGVSDSEQASSLVAALLGPYRRPAAVRKMTPSRLVAGTLWRRVRSFVESRLVDPALQ